MKEAPDGRLAATFEDTNTGHLHLKSQVFHYRCACDPLFEVQCDKLVENRLNYHNPKRQRGIFFNAVET